MRLRRPVRGEVVSPVSFFACQDIMFAAGGIFLFISVMLAMLGKISRLSLEETGETAAQLAAVRAEAATKVRLTQQLEALAAWREREASTRANAVSGAEVDDPWLADPDALAQEADPLAAKVEAVYGRLVEGVLEMNRRESRLELLQTGGMEALVAEGHTVVRAGPVHDFRETLFLVVGENGLLLEWRGRPELAQSFPETAGFLEHLEARFAPDTQKVLIHLRPSGIDRFDPLLRGLRSRGFRVGYEPVAEGFRLNEGSPR